MSRILFWKSALLVLCFVLAPSPTASQGPPPFPSRVLITNDNGIDDPKLIALARGFAVRAETWVVAPASDRSGTGSFMSLGSTGAVNVEPVDLGPGIRAYAVDGFPADCVAVALLGLMQDAPPELVVSGINGGPNLGTDWMFSGTIGAARVAALGGFPAVAVSGLDDDVPGAVEAAVAWVVRLAGSEAVRGLEPGAYLTVSLPANAPDGIRGIRVTDRAGLIRVPRLRPENATTWRVVGTDEVRAPAPDSDAAAWEEGYIAVVPMRADEVDTRRLVQWRRAGAGLPAWRGGTVEGR
jgi:5'-nucleotidase